MWGEMSVEECLAVCVTGWLAGQLVDWLPKCGFQRYLYMQVLQSCQRNHHHFSPPAQSPRPSQAHDCTAHATCFNGRAAVQGLLFPLNTHTRTHRLRLTHEKTVFFKIYPLIALHRANPDANPNSVTLSLTPILILTHQAQTCPQNDSASLQ